MAIKETARLEHEAEQTRAQLEQTLGELRARMSPGQLLDQATDYFRNNSGRAFVSNLREEVVHNPVPVALIGAGIAWLALSGTMGRRRNGGQTHMEHDWGETAATAHDLAQDGRGMSAAERAATAYDETIAHARETAEDWSEEARATAHDVRERTAGMYDQTRGGIRRMARRAADYGRAARQAVQPEGALVNFCREQPMLVAGLGIAVGAALAAMIPSSRAERQVMGETSRELQDRVREAASGKSRSMSEAQGERSPGDLEQRESWQSETTRGEGWRGETWREPAREAAADVERGIHRSDRASNLETEPQSAPYAEAAEAGATGTPPPREDESKQRT